MVLDGRRGKVQRAEACVHAGVGCAVQKHQTYWIYVQAPEPSTILWENLQFSRWDKLIRQLVIFFLALLVIAASVSMAFTAR
jgi:hypothetical protein